MYKYNCKQCKFNTNYESVWERHINTTKHKTGKRKTRSDKKKPIECDKCDYIAKTSHESRLHRLNNHSTIKERKKEFKHYCDMCDYGSFTPYSYKRHTNTKKHKHIMKVINK